MGRTFRPRARSLTLRKTAFDPLDANGTWYGEDREGVHSTAEGFMPGAPRHLSGSSSPHSSVPCPLSPPGSELLPNPSPIPAYRNSPHTSLLVIAADSEERPTEMLCCTRHLLEANTLGKDTNPMEVLSETSQPSASGGLRT